MMVLLLASLLALVSCVSNSSYVPSSDSVSPAIDAVPKITVSPCVDVKVTAEFVSCPLSYACSYLTTLCPSSPAVVLDEFSSKTCTLSCDSVSYLDALSLIARSVDLDLIPCGPGFFLGKATDNDNIIVSGHVSGYSPDILSEILRSSLGGCSVYVAPDGYAVINAPVSCVQRARDALELLKKSRPLYRIRIIAVSNWFDADLLDGSLGVSGSRVLPLRDWYWSNMLTGSFALIINGSCIKTVVHQTHDYYCVDGDDLYIYKGTKQPIPKHTISDSGTNSISGYDILPIGDTLKLRCNMQSDNSVLCSVQHESSSSSGMVGDYPVSESNELKSSVRLNFGDVYCIGSYTSDDTRFGLLRFAAKRRNYRLLMSVTRIDCI